MKSQLRDLADLISRTARDHPAYSQAHEIVTNCTDHLSARARIEEQNRQNIQVDKYVDAYNILRSASAWFISHEVDKKLGHIPQWMADVYAKAFNK